MFVEGSCGDWSDLMIIEIGKWKSWDKDKV